MDTLKVGLIKIRRVIFRYQAEAGFDVPVRSNDLRFKEEKRDVAKA